MMRVTVPILFGIVVGQDVPITYLFSACILLLLCRFLLQRTSKKALHGVRLGFADGIFYAFCFMLVGMALVATTDLRLDSHHIMHQSQPHGLVALRLDDEPKATARGWSVIGEALAIIEGDSLCAVRGKVSLFLNDTLHLRACHVDDVIWVSAGIVPVAGARNPNEFDFAAYRAQRGIHVQMFAQESAWIKDSTHHKSTAMGACIKLREDLLSCMRQQPIEERELGVLSALVLGKTTELDSDLMQAYASAGAVHVLAVSGLHVALIYVLLKPFFLWVFGKRRARWLRCGIPVVLLWIYAALTGFSPSVLRAALMFTSFIIGETYARTSDVFNTMFASVFILLVCDPKVIYAMGFILSYLAVAGIVVLTPMLKVLWISDYRCLRKVWETITVSIAAQLATMPVTVFMFHSFPTWFIITNLVVVPLSSIVLYTALVFFGMLWWASGAAFFGGLMGLLTRIMNDMMVWSAQWPYALIDGIYWSTTELFCCVGLIIFGCCALLFRIPRGWLVVMVLCVAWLGHAILGEVQRSSRKSLCFFSVRNHDMCTYLGDGMAYSYRDDSREGAIAAFNRIALPFIQSNHVRHSCIVGPNQEFKGEAITFAQGKLQLKDVAVVQVDSLGSCFSAIHAVQVFWFTHTSNRLYLREDQIEMLEGKTVILGNTYSRKKREWLKKRLGDDSFVFDLTESAVIWEQGHWSSHSNE